MRHTADADAMNTSRQTPQDPVDASEQADTKLSFGAAMLGAPPADGYNTPHQGLPDTWLASFTEQHADAAVWSGLFTSCRSGRDFALTHARTATATLSCVEHMPPAGWQRQVVAVRHALGVRCALPTRLCVHRGRSTGRASQRWLAALVDLFSHIYGAGYGVAEVDLSVWGCDFDVTAVLLYMAAACPNVHTLTLLLNDTSVQHLAMLQPHQLPRLRSLALVSELGTLRVSGHVWMCHVMPLLPQLTALRLPYCHGLLHKLFQPTTLPLTHMHVNESLTGELVQKLLKHAPNLKSLRVWDIVLRSREHGDKVWGVEDISFMKPSQHWEAMAHVSSWLAGLPQPRTGRTVIASTAGSANATFTVESVQGIAASVSERLALWRFDVPRVTVQCDGVPPADQPAALRCTLRQLADMQAPDATVWLQGWDWPAVADTVAECLPLLPHLHFGVHMGWGPLPDAWLFAILQMGPHMRRLSVLRLALQSDHSGVAWPWEELCVETLDVAQLLKLPVPAAKVAVRAGVLAMESCGALDEADLARLAGVLQRVQWTAINERTLVVWLRGSNNQRQMAAVRALRFGDGPAAVNHVKIYGSQVALDAVSAHHTTDLPQWPVKVSFKVSQ